MHVCIDVLWHRLEKTKLHNVEIPACKPTPALSYTQKPGLIQFGHPTEVTRDV